MVVLRPLPRERLIGRVEELALLGAAFQHSRLVTLCGPPGIGKTTTACAYLQQQPESSVSCDLSLATTPSQLAYTLADQLGIQDSHDPRAALLAGHQTLPTLLLLDNAEQVLAPLCSLLDEWMAKNDELRFLVTSREKLRMAGERTLELPPLALAGHDGSPAEAAQLFVERWRDSDPTLQLDDGQHDAVAQIVARLDGIPLAIELAAARAPTLGLARLLSRLDDPLTLLSRGKRGASERQATLRGAIDWSWRLLSPAQQQALAYCAVFCGPFDIDAAEAVIGDEALDLLQDLRERSLLTTPQPGHFTMYASIAAFALEALDKREDSAMIKTRHARHFIGLAMPLATHFERRGGAMKPLLNLHDNLLRATEYALAKGAPALAADGCLALAPALRTRGPLQQHLALLDEVMQQLDEHPALLRARAHARRGLGDSDGAQADLVAAIDCCDDDWLYVACRKDLGVLHHHQRDMDAARACYEAALGHARALDDDRIEAIVIGNLGALDHDGGRFESAAVHYQQALEKLRAVDDKRLEAIFLTNLGVLEQEQGQRKRAARSYRRALALLVSAPDLRFEGIALGNLGVMEHEAGNVVAARQLHEQALKCLRRVGERHSEALCLARLAACRADRGERERAEANLRAAEALARQLPLTRRVVRLYRCFVDLADGDERAALRRISDAQAGHGEEPNLAEVSDDARAVLRMLSHRLDDAGAPHLEVAADGSWFRAPGGDRQSLEKYTSVRRILACLSDARQARPGEAVAAEKLFEVGWPDVRIARRSAMNRLFVALAKLRKFGLKLLLLRDGDGYLLDPETPLLRAAAGHEVAH